MSATPARWAPCGEVSVRALGSGDAPAVAALGDRRVAAGDAWEAPGPGAPGVVALADGAIAGLGWVEWWDESDGTHLYLLHGFVDPEHRGGGIGQRLLDALESWSNRHGAARGVEVTFAANAD